MDHMDVYLEIGQKRTFAGALDWPGWSRAGRDEGSALEALLDYAPRYARALGPSAAVLGFAPPAGASALVVVERLSGGSGTDFGAPGAIPARDADPVSATELERLREVLRACWRAFDLAATAAEGQELATGPRGGGRDLNEIVRHVLEGQAAYLSRVSWKGRLEEARDDAAARELIRQAVPEALAAAARGETPAAGPRGGARWPPRYFTRRSAWHILDHAWEIEDRVQK